MTKLFPRREPNNGRNGNCAGLKVWGNWNDFQCWRKKQRGGTMNALCERSLQQPSRTATTKSPTIRGTDYLNTPVCGKQQKPSRTQYAKMPGRKNCENCQKIGEDGKAGKDYKGKVATTISGRKCQKWSEQTPHTHKWGNEGNHNFCRNLDNHNGVWCYTTDKNKRWEDCDVPMCEGETCIIDHSSL